MDEYMRDLGYEPLHTPIADIDQPIKQGIDGVYRHPGPPPKYAIGEAKYGKSKLSKLTDGTRQMSDDWIDDRLLDAVGDQDLADEIIESGYEKFVAKVDSSGNITSKLVDESGYIIRGNKGVFRP